MTKEEIKQKTSLCFLLNPNIPEEEKICVIEKVMATKATIVSKVALCNIITYILKQNAELKDKLEILISVGNTCTKGLDKQLTKAKEILRKFLDAKSIEETCVAESEADKFLNSEAKESCPDWFCEDCTKEDCEIKELGLV